MRREELALATLAESVADGTPVDWQAAEADSPDVRRLVRHLRLVDSIAALHRSVAVEEDAAPAVGRETPGGQRWGRLVLLERIGAGTSSEVYRAWDAELHRDVALKLLHDLGKPDTSGAGDPDPATQMLHEARRMARLRHEHVVQVYGAEEHDGRLGLWMEHVRGTSLDEIVGNRGPLGASEATLIGLDICAALAAVHGAGLLHRDVKAQNVMREDGGRIVLMDFGTGEDLAGSNRLVGTPIYLAPEIILGQRASVQSDIYALGVLLFYLVTGRFPVPAGSFAELLAAHQKRLRTSLRDLRPDAPQAFVAVVERAIDSDPARRYRSVGELESALREALAPPLRGRSAEPRSDPAGATARPAPGRRKSTVPAAMAAAIVLAAAAVVLIVWTRAGENAAGRLTRVGILPFRTESALGTAPYLADQLTDNLIATLGKIGSLQVTSLASVLPFKQNPPPMPEIARQLRVDDLVEATLLVATTADGQPDRVRVRARVIAAGTGATRWSRDFDRSLGEAQALHADVARAIVEAIGLTLTDEERRLLQAAPPTLPQANAEYFLGMHFLSQSSSDATRAVEAFKRAIAIDPQHAGAHAGLARGLMTLGDAGALQHPTARAVAATEVRRALDLDPYSSEAHAVDADLRFFYDWDWAGADQAYRRAIELNRSFARARSQYARFLAAAGRPAEALAQAARAVDLEPTSASAVSTRALIEYFARDYATALQTSNRAIQLEPDRGSHYIVLARIQAATGDVNGAISSVERALSLQGSESATSWRVALVRLHAQAGRHAEARRELAELTESLAAARRTIYPTHLAYVHDALGERDTAIKLLDRAVGDRDPDVLWLAVDPRVDDLKDDPRFAKIVQRLGIPR